MNNVWVNIDEATRGEVPRENNTSNTTRYATTVWREGTYHKGYRDDVSLEGFRQRNPKSDPEKGHGYL